MLRFGKTKVAKEEFNGAKKHFEKIKIWKIFNILKIWDGDIDNIVILKLIKTENNSRYLIRYLDEVIRPLALILPKMSGYIKTFEDEIKILINIFVYR